MAFLQTLLALIISCSTVLGIFTKVINKMFDKKLSPMQKSFDDRLNNIEKKIDDEHNDSLQKDMSQWRYSVVQFANSLHKGEEHSRYEYEAIFVYIDNYEDAVEELKIKNTVFEEEVLFIKDCYHKLIGTK